MTALDQIDVRILEELQRDARLTKIFEGTSEIQLRIVSDRLLGKPPRKKS